MLNPIKRMVYIPKELVETELLESGYLALHLGKSKELKCLIQKKKY